MQKTPTYGSCFIHFVPNTGEEACLFYRRYEDNPEKDAKESEKTKADGSEEEVNGEAKKSQ